MKRKWLFLLLSVVMAMSFVFVACDETDEDNPDVLTLAEKLEGTWVRQSGTNNDVMYAARYTVVLDGTEMTIHSDQEMPPLWLVFDPTVQLTFAEDGFVVTTSEHGDIEFTATLNDAGNDLVLELTYEEHAYSEHLVKLGNTTATELVANWDLQTILAEGGEEPVAANGYINLLANRTGTMMMLDMQEEEAISWCKTGDYLVIINTENKIGAAVSYTIDGTTMTAVEQVMVPNLTYVFEKIEPQGDLDEYFFGTWMRSMGYEGDEFIEAEESVVFNSNGTGIHYRFDDEDNDPGKTDDDDDELVADPFSWAVDGEELVVTMDDGDIERMGFTKTNENVTVLEFEDDGVQLRLTFIRKTGDLDEDLYGMWSVISETIGGVPAEEFGGILTLNDDGTGSYSAFGEMEEFDWSVNPQQYFLIGIDHTVVGFVGSYVLEGDNLVLTTHEDDGEIVTTLAPFEPGNNIDENLAAAWMLESIDMLTEDDDIMPTTFIFGLDGTGLVRTFVMWNETLSFKIDEDPEDPEIEDYIFTWQASEGTVTINFADTEMPMIETGYQITGNELHFDEVQGLAMNFYRYGGELDPTFVGRWVEDIQFEIDPFGEMSDQKMSSTVEFKDDGEMTVYSMDMEDEPYEEEMEWLVSEDRLLIMMDDMFGMVVPYVFSNGEVSVLLTPAGDDEMTFFKFTGTNPAEYVDTWHGFEISFEIPMMGEAAINMPGTLEINADGTGSTLMIDMDPEEGESLTFKVNEEEIGEPEDFEWIISPSGKLIVITESMMSFVIDSEISEPVMTLSGIMGPMAGIAEMEQTYVRHSDENDTQIVGIWNKTDELVNGTSTGETFEVTVTMMADGTMNYEDGDDSGEGTWNTNTTYLLIHAMEEAPEGMVQVMEYTVSDTEMRVTVRMADDTAEIPSFVEITEVFTRAE